MIFLTKKNIKTIWVTPETHSRLLSLKGILQSISPKIITFDDVINKLLDFYEKGGKVKVNPFKPEIMPVKEGEKKQ